MLLADNNTIAETNSVAFDEFTVSDSKERDNLIDFDIQRQPEALSEDLVAQKDDINKAQDDKNFDMR